MPEKEKSKLTIMLFSHGCFEFSNLFVLLIDVTITMMQNGDYVIGLQLMSFYFVLKGMTTWQSCLLWSKHFRPWKKPTLRTV